MSYENKDFWEQYKKYVDESLYVHKKICFSLLSFCDLSTYHFTYSNLLDFGCGKCQEARLTIAPKQYFGIDELFEPSEVVVGAKINYRKEFDLIKKHITFDPNIFSSLFSIEPTATTLENRILYEKIFHEFPNIKCGVVSGFYYGNMRHQKSVAEKGGIISYQSIDDLADIKSEVYDEIRMIVPNPSKMFGKDVIEVWKLLIRK